MRILVVEDSLPVRARIGALLRELRQVEVSEVGDAREAIEHLRVQRVDILVLDVHMPGENGFDVLGFVRRTSLETLVIILTNDPSETHRRQAFLRGADHFLDKSRDFDRLVELVHGWRETRESLT